MNKKIAVSYFRDRANITDEKLDVLDMNSQDIKLIYITDIMNGGIEEQFPEWLIKIPQRTKQKYDSNICPECGSRLIERNGRNGRFMGCSGYPRCKYTRSIR